MLSPWEHPQHVLVVVKSTLKTLGHCNLSRTIAKSQQKISAMRSPYYQTLASLAKHLKSLKGIGCMEMESFEPT